MRNFWLYRFSIKTIDKNWNKYSDEVESSFDIRDFIKVWDVIRTNSTDIFWVDRTITFIEKPLFEDK